MEETETQWGRLWYGWMWRRQEPSCGIVQDNHTGGPLKKAVELWHRGSLEESNGELTDGRIMKREVGAILRSHAMQPHRWSLEEGSSAPHWKSLVEGYGALTQMDELWGRQVPRAPFQLAFTGESDSVLVGLPILFTNQLDGPVNARPGVPQRLPLLSRLMVWGPAGWRGWCSLSVTWAIDPFLMDMKQAGVESGVLRTDHSWGYIPLIETYQVEFCGVDMDLSCLRGCWS